MKRRQRPSDEATARFGENLMICRRRTRLSQEELGFRVGMHRNQISDLERGQHFLGMDAAVRLAGSLGVSVEEFVAGLAWTPGYTVVVAGEWGVTDPGPAPLPRSAERPSE
jgi:transcriptional regulator with XRE-family HTH domain